MISGNTKFNLKIFQIDKSYYEFDNKSSSEIIDIIKDNHEKHLRHKFESLELIKPEIKYQKYDDFEFWSYCYNQPKKKYYWKLFLPESLTENQNFNIVEFSFVLFINYKTDIYCVISGSGMSVIKKYIHPSFGIDIYQRLANPREDVIIELETRGIANNISQKKQIFNYNQTIAETIEYSEIPTKIKLKIREELKNNEFKKYQFDDDLTILEVGSYFYLRKRIDFEELIELIKDIDLIKKHNNPKQLTLFSKINDPTTVKELDNELKKIVVNDILLHNNPSQIKDNISDVIEVVHPSKLEQFYTCDSFIIRSKYSRGKNDIIVNDRNNLYYKCTKHIFDSLENTTDRYDATGKLLTLNIAGHINGKETTYANFFAHITAEMEYSYKKYFKIDGHWYLLEDDFLKLMNDDAKAFYEKYKLKYKILNKWEKDKDEDFYNKSHSSFPNHYVLDKVIKNNIELCDLLVIEDNKAFFIHVKNGFNATMRDLYIQVILSAKRLSNDLKNNEGSSYLLKTLKEYNSRNESKEIEYNGFIDDLKNGNLKINYVMAYRNGRYKGKTSIEKIESSKSNIAKYALIQVIKEMQQFDFDINLYDISELE